MSRENQPECKLCDSKRYIKTGLSGILGKMRCPECAWMDDYKFGKPDGSGTLSFSRPKDFKQRGES